jgi:hypothetical protein
VRPRSGTYFPHKTRSGIMRLLHSETLSFHEFYDGGVPPYAILSHTWGEQEMTFKDMRKRRNFPKERYRKIQNCAYRARKDGYSFIWVDTCCIDKSSSAELTEAINSMYQWYKESQVCYTYLEDYLGNQKDFRNETLNLSRCRWFTRGWTLQELLAPHDVKFFSRDWQFLGSKSDDYMREFLPKITGIPEEYICGEDISGASVAQRMVWASKRKTTRVEDIAYSLLGIFNVNMPLLYGEREKAFIRLQEEIIKKTEDQSIFVWTSTENGSRPLETLQERVWGNKSTPMESTGLLAPSPANFHYNARHDSGQRFSPEYSATMKGLKISLQLLPLDPVNDIYLAKLKASDGFTSGRVDEADYYLILLRCISLDQKQYSRIRSDIVIYETKFKRYEKSIRKLLNREQSLGEFYVTSSPLHDSFGVLHVLVKTEGKSPRFSFSCERAYYFTKSKEMELEVDDSSVDSSLEDDSDRIALHCLIRPFQKRFILLVHRAPSMVCLFSLHRNCETPYSELSTDMDHNQWRIAHWGEEISETVVCGSAELDVTVEPVRVSVQTSGVELLLRVSEKNELSSETYSIR